MGALFSETDEWRITEGDTKRLHYALYVRDALGLTPVGDSVPPALAPAVDRYKDGTSPPIDGPRWLRWWNDLLDEVQLDSPRAQEVVEQRWSAPPALDEQARSWAFHRHEEWRRERHRRSFEVVSRIMEGDAVKALGRPPRSVRLFTLMVNGPWSSVHSGSMLLMSADIRLDEKALHELLIPVL